MNRYEEMIKSMYTDNLNELSKNIDKYLIPHELEKKVNAEVSTPYRLRQEMLDKIPTEFWLSPKKVLEPCAGKGGFVVDIVHRFMEGLKNTVPDEKERYRTIVEECIYFCDINSVNIFICKLLLDPYGEYKLQYYEGDTLKYEPPCLFDAVIGNPPYNSSGNIATGNTVWQLFTKKALTDWLLNGGYLVFVHPSGWRKPCCNKSQLKGLYELMSITNQMLYLSIHGIKDGQQTFKCGTRYDWYIIEKNRNCRDTVIYDETRIKSTQNLKHFYWLPNKNISDILKIISNDMNLNLNIIADSSYHATRVYVSDCKNDVYKYPLIHSTPKSGVRYKYSSRNDKGHFNVPKFIFGETGIDNIVIDVDGKYGMTQGAIGIEIVDTKNITNIYNALSSDKFKNILESCTWGNFRIDYRIFTYLRKDFWKEFI